MNLIWTQIDSGAWRLVHNGIRNRQRCDHLDFDYPVKSALLGWLTPCTGGWRWQEYKTLYEIRIPLDLNGAKEFMEQQVVLTR